MRSPVRKVTQDSQSRQHRGFFYSLPNADWCIQISEASAACKEAICQKSGCCHELLFHEAVIRISSTMCYEINNRFQKIIIGHWKSISQIIPSCSYSGKIYFVKNDTQVLPYLATLGERAVGRGRSSFGAKFNSFSLHIDLIDVRFSLIGGMSPMSSHSHGLGLRSKLIYAPGCGPMGISAPTFGAGEGGNQSVEQTSTKNSVGERIFQASNRSVAFS